MLIPTGKLKLQFSFTAKKKIIAHRISEEKFTDILTKAILEKIKSMVPVMNLSGVIAQGLC